MAVSTDIHEAYKGRSYRFSEFLYSMSAKDPRRVTIEAAETKYLHDRRSISYVQERVYTEQMHGCVEGREPRHLQLSV